MLRLFKERSRYALLLLLSIISSAGCASDAPVIGQFPVLQDSFDTYRAAAHNWLADRSMPHRSQSDIELNLPFEWTADPAEPHRGKFLLFHGLNDSPYVWHDHARELTALGFDVRAILFDGHGSTPEDMLQVRWQAWMDSARAHLDSINDGSSPVYLGGFSMGAVIATWLALDNPEIAGLFLVSPAYDSQLNHYLRWSGLYALFKPWVFGGMILEDNPIKYNSIPVNSGWQYYQLTRELKRRWRRDDRIEIPTLVVMSNNDSVVDVSYTRKLFRRKMASDKRLLLQYASSSVEEAVKKDSHATDPSPFEQTRSSRFLNLRILNQSHLGLMYSPDNTLFGQNGSILVCNGNEYPIFMACMRSVEHWYGAQHTPSPDGTAVARTTYNPDWQVVIEEFKRVFVQ